MRTTYFPVATILLMITSGCSSETRGLPTSAAASATTGTPAVPPAACDAACNTLWSKAFGGQPAVTDFVQVHAMATDADGDVFVAGFAANGVDLGGGKAVGGRGLFLGKLDPAGNLLWSQGFAGTPNESFSGMAVDATTGELTLVGTTLSAAIDFGGAVLRSDPGGSNQGVFVVRLDAQGHHEWSRRYNLTTIGENAGLAAEAMALGAEGETVLTAFVQGTANIAGTMITQEAGFGTLVVKLDAGGALVFADLVGGTDSNALTDKLSVAIDDSDDIVIGGSFFGSLNVGGTVFTSKGVEDALVMKLDPAGAMKWGRTLGGPNSDRALDLALGADGLIYLPGFFSDGADLGQGALTVKGGGTTSYLAVLDPNGDTRRVTTFTTPPAAGYASHVAVLSSGSAVVVLDGAPDTAIEVASVDGSGVVLPGTRTFQADLSLGESLLLGTLLTLDPGGHVVLAGALTGTTNFGTGEIGIDLPGPPTSFVAKLAP